MRNLTPWRRSLAILISMMLVLAGAAFAQDSVGNVYGRVSDDKGEKLPGVTVTLTGPGAEKLQVTDEGGEFRFLGLDPGNYKIEASLEGFGTVVYEAVNIRIGRNTTIELAMNPAIEETITVTTESPLLDERKISNGIQVTSLELQKIPTAKDPWAVAGQTPGVLMDRINVGGNESGQQPNFIGSGAGTAQNKFMIDGVDITDMSALGASSTYFGFEQFEEMSFTTGGTDVAIETPGVQLNMVTKRGTNEWRGSANYGLADKEYQASSNFGIEDLPPQQQNSNFGGGNRINKIIQYGAEAGGFLWKDRIWIWGAYDENDIKNFVITGQPDDTVLENIAYKVNAQITDANSFVYTKNEGDKIKFGRGAGANRPPETTWNQDGPSPLQKAEDTHVFNSKFFLTAQWSEMLGGFNLEPQGGRDAQGWQDIGGIFHGSFYWLENERPSERVKLDGSYFFASGSTSHELKFGYSYRTAEEQSLYGAPGNGIFTYPDTGSGPGAIVYAQFVGENAASVESEYTGIWAQDTISLDRLTINVGFRYDEQTGKNVASTSPANSVAPSILPEIAFQGNDVPFEWKDISPRVGVTWALGAERKTLLRASFSRFADQLGMPLINAINPVVTRYAYFLGTDVNGNGILDPNEPRTFQPNDSVGFDPSNPAALSSPNVLDPDLKAVVTDELLLGVEHSLLPEFVVGVNLTYRTAGDYYDQLELYSDAAGNVRPLTRDDYVFNRNITGTLRDGTTFSVPVYGVRSGLSNTGGSFITNTDRETEYLGVSFTATKRLSNKWMLRGHFTWYDWQWNIGEEYRQFDDPTNVLNADNNIFFGTDDDGAIYADQSGGSGNFNQFLNSTWSFNVSALYQLPWGMNASANINGREGYPIPFAARNVARPGAPRANVQVTPDVDTYRMDDIFTIDARIDKDFQIGDLSLTLSADIFNLLNDGAIIQNEYLSGTVGGGSTVPLSTLGNVNQIIGPRIVRFGVRLAWK